MAVLNLSSIHLLLLFFSLSGVDGFFSHAEVKCRFSSFGYPYDIEYLEQFYFNKMFLGQYNGTSEKWTGTTKSSQHIAEAFNKDPGFLRQKRKDMEKNCRSKIPAVYEYVDAVAEPYVKLRSVKPDSSRHPAMLVCSVYDFYPKPIRVTWLRDGQEVMSDVTSTTELANGDWYYQMHSHLEYTPTPEERITCMVEHASFTEPKLYDWASSHPESERNKISIGASGLLLGVVFVAAGLIYYRKKSTEHTLVPNS